MTPVRAPNGERGFSPLRATSAPLRVVAHAEFDASPVELWNRISHHEALANWVPFVRSAASGGAQPVRGVGATRSCRVAGLGRLVEEVLHWDPPLGHAVRIYASHMPTRDHVATLRVREREGGGSRLVLEHYFDLTGHVRALFFPRVIRELTRKSLRNLQRELGGAGVDVRRAG